MSSSSQLSPRLVFNRYKQRWVSVNGRPLPLTAHRRDDDLGFVGGAEITYGSLTPFFRAVLAPPRVSLSPYGLDSSSLEVGEISIMDMARRSRQKRSKPTAPISPPLTRSKAVVKTRSTTTIKKASTKVRQNNAPSKNKVVLKAKKVGKVARFSKKVVMKRVKAAPKKLRQKKKNVISELCEVGTVPPLHLCPQFDETELVPASAPNDTMFELADIMQNATDLSLLNDEQNLLMNSATSQSRGYILRKSAIVKRFFAVLERDPRLRRLCETVPKADFPDETIRVFFVELSGSKSELKHRVLNQCLVVFGFLGLLRPDGRIMEPNTSQTVYKMLFSAFRVSAMCLILLYSIHVS
jgi:hypothetical protein